MGQEEPPGPIDWGFLRTPRGQLLGGELLLCGTLVGLLAPPAPPTLAPALLQTLGGAAALGGRLLRDPPRLPPGWGTGLNLLRALSGSIIFLAVALVAATAPPRPLAAATCTFSLILTLLFAFDFFVTFRTRVAPPGPDRDGDAA